MKEINEEIVRLLENDQVGIDYWFSQLGYSNSKINNELGDHELIYDYYEQGERIWNKYKQKLRELICDKNKGEPKLMINELIGGDIRELLQYIVSIIIAKFSIAIVIAIPLACLIIKFQLNKFCSN